MKLLFAKLLLSPHNASTAPIAIDAPRATVLRCKALQLRGQSDFMTANAAAHAAWAVFYHRRMESTQGLAQHGLYLRQRETWRRHVRLAQVDARRARKLKEEAAKLLRSADGVWDMAMIGGLKPPSQWAMMDGLLAHPP